MLTALIIGITPDVTQHVSRFCGESGDICVYKELESYPDLHELAHLANAYAPEIVFLQLWAPAEESVEPARVREAVEEIRMVHPGASLIGLLPGADEEGLRTAKDLGIIDLLILPFHRQEFSEAIFRALDRSSGMVKGSFHSFLPAKSGSGATVTALNVAGCLARQFHRKVLLLEGDLLSGPIAVMLNIQPEQSVSDAIEYSAELTHESWSRMVTRVDGLDVLATSGAKCSLSASQFSYFRLVNFAQRHYDDIIVDLPGVVDEAAEPLLTHSRGIYLVCTPEVASLALARRRFRQLEMRGVRDSVLGVILNRYDQTHLSKERIAEVVGHPIAVQLPNDYQAVKESIESGGFVDPDTELGKAYARFAASLAGLDPQRLPGVSRLKALLRRLGGSAPDEGAHAVHLPEQENVRH
jgi:Flp pilus assembly CpaE family ATPase